MSSSSHHRHHPSSASSSRRHHHPRPSATTTPARAPPLSLSSPLASMRVPRPPTTAMHPRSARAANPTTAVSHRRSSAPKDAWPPYDEDRLSRSDSRRSGSRRDLSPPSAHQYRSTPDTRRSSRTSMSDSADDTDVTTSSQDDKDERSPRKEVKDLYVVPADRRRRHHRHKSPRRTHQEIIYEEEDDEEEARGPEPDDDEDDDDDEEEVYECVGREETPARHHVPSPPRRIEEKRSRSRHSSERPGQREHHRRRHQSSRRDHSRVTSRVTSVEEERPAPSSKRSSKKYYESEVVYSERMPSSLRRSNTTGDSHPPTPQTVSSSARRSSGFFGNFFASSRQPPPPPKPVKLVVCVVCMDDLPSRKTARLKCGHRMCSQCLKRSFKLSMADPQHMPPRCCTSHPIPLKHVERLFDSSFKKTWNKKFAEHTTRNRLYCPSRRCDEWIRPEDMYREDGRGVAKCSRCKTKVCCLCSGKWHKSRECPRDEETSRFLEQAKEEGWQRCYRCKAMVELREGCNHMTCRCGAEFCMICGMRWRTCDCSWFNFGVDDAENDRLDHMQIPIPMRTPDRRDYHTTPSPREYRGERPAPTRLRPQSYEEDVYLHRLQEQRDEEFASRLQMSEDYHDRDDYLDGMGDMTGLGTQAERFMNDDFRRRPEHIIVPSPPPPPQYNPFERVDRMDRTDRMDRVDRVDRVDRMDRVDRTDRMDRMERMDRVDRMERVDRVDRVERVSAAPPPPPDYLSGINRARGARASSMERRLADRFNMDLRQSPTSRSAMADYRTHRQSMGGGDYAGPPPMLRTSMTMPTSLPTSLPTTATALPMAPAPPAAVPMMRRHTLEDDRYKSSSPRSRLSERPAPSPFAGYDYGDYDSEAGAQHPPYSRHRQHHRDPPKQSVMAGLTGPGSGMNRVFEWRTHVEPGPPSEESL